MNGQVTAGMLVGAIPKVVIIGWLNKRLTQVGKALAAVVEETLTPDISPKDAHRFECAVEEHTREFSRSFHEQCFNCREPKNVESMPEKIQYLGQTYRRLKHKTNHETILTRFGNITIIRATYRQGNAGATVSPLVIALGIDRGMTPGALMFRSTTGSSFSPKFEGFTDSENNSHAGV